MKKREKIGGRDGKGVIDNEIKTLLDSRDSYIKKRNNEYTTNISTSKRNIIPHINIDYILHSYIPTNKNDWEEIDKEIKINEDFL